MKQWLVGLIILLAAGIYAEDTAPGKAATNRVIRIALLPLDSSEEVQSIIPLLTASLSASHKVQLFERADLERIISEQRLGLSGLTDPATQLRLGQLIQADGMVLLSKDIDRNRIAFHMVETRQGLRVCLMSYPLSERALVAVIGDIQDDLLRSLNKLSLDTSKCLLISIARIGNVTLIPNSSWIETELPGLMEECLSRYPRVLILERRQLGRLLDEAKLAGQEAVSFRADGIIIDGELALTTGVPLDKKAPAVTFTARFRNAAGRDLGRVAVQGTLNDKETLIARIVAAAINKIRELGRQTGGRTEDESELWLDLARKQGSLWAAESAYALNPTNTETLVTLIELLLAKGASEHNPRPESRCCHISSETGEQHADALVRAYAVYGSAPGPRPRQIFAAIVNNKGFFLCQEYSRDNPRIIERLKPVRRLIRLAIEEGDDLHLLGYGSAAFCDDPLDQISYARNFAQRVIKDTPVEARCLHPAMLGLKTKDIKDAPAEWRCHYLINFFEGMWGFEERVSHGNIDYYERPSVKNAWNRFYHELRSSPEPTAVFLASYYLAGKEQSDEERQRLVQEAVVAGDRVVARCGAQCGEALADMYAVTRHIRSPRQDVEIIIGKIKRRPKQQYATPPPTPDKSLPPLSVPSGTASRVAATNERVLFSTALPEWSKQVRFLKPPGFNPSRERGCIIPQRLLLDGANLWIGAGSYGGWRGIGLLQLELPSGRMVSLRVGDFPDWGKDSAKRAMGNMDSNFIDPDITSMRRWNDAICIGQKHVGVYLFPVAVPAKDHGMNGVQLLTSKDGLLDLNISAVTCIGSDLFIVATGNIVCWNRETRKIRLILNTADQLGATPLGNPGEIAGLTSDRHGRSLHAFFPPSPLKNDWTIWSLSLTDGKWTDINTNIKKIDKPLALDSFHEFKAGKIVLGRHYAFLSKTNSSNRTFAYGGQFDADSGALARYDSKAFNSLLPAIPSMRIQEAVEYNGGIIAILGNGTDQRVSYFPGVTFQSAISSPTR